MRDHEPESALRNISSNEASFFESALALHVENVAESGLDPKTHAVARIAALVALDAPPASFDYNVAIAQEAGLTTDEILGILVALAPTVGFPRIVSAAPSIASWSTRGMKSGVQPWIGCGSQAGWLSDGEPSAVRTWACPLLTSEALAGSVRMIFVSGRSLRSTRATPETVPPVP